MNKYILFYNFHKNNLHFHYMIIEGSQRQRLSVGVQNGLVLPGFVNVFKGGTIDIIKEVDKPDIAFEIVVGHSSCGLGQI